MNDVNEDDGACWRWRWLVEDGDDKMTSINIPATITAIDGMIALFLLFVLVLLFAFAFVSFLFSSFIIIIVRDVTVIGFDGSVVVVIILIFIVYPLQTILINIDARKKKR